MPRANSSNKVAPAPPAKLLPNLPAPYPQMSLSQTVKEGVGLGIGSAIGHRIVGAFFPTNSTIVPSVSAPPPQKVEPCATERRVFENCLLNESQYFCHEQQRNLTTCLKTLSTPAETK